MEAMFSSFDLISNFNEGIPSANADFQGVLDDPHWLLTEA